MGLHKLVDLLISSYLNFFLLEFWITKNVMEKIKFSEKSWIRKWLRAHLLGQQSCITPIYITYNMLIMLCFKGVNY